MNKNYFRFLIRYHRVPLVFFFVFYMTIALSGFLTGAGSDLHSGLPRVIESCMIMSILLSFGIPIYLFSWVHSRKSCDVYGALPYSRKEQLITSMAAAFLVCFGYFLAATIIPASIGIARNALYLSGYLEILGEMALGSLTLLLFNTGIYLVASNALDGIMMLGAYHLLPVMLMMTVSAAASNLIAGMDAPNMTLISWLSPVYSAGSLVINAFDASLVQNSDVITREPLWPRNLILIGFLICSVLLLKNHFLNRKLERAEQLSDNILAYPFVIRVYTAMCLLILISGMFRGNADFITLILVFAAFLVSQFVYRRTIRPDWKMIVQFLILLASAFAVSAFGWKTRGFYLADRELDYAHAQSITFRLWKDDGARYLALNMDLKLNSDDKDAIALLEQIRRKSADEFYRKSSDQSVSDSEKTYDYNNFLSVETHGASFTYYFYPSDNFTSDELRTLAKHGSSDIEKYSYETGMTEELTLDDFLEQMEK